MECTLLVAAVGPNTHLRSGFRFAFFEISASITDEILVLLIRNDFLIKKGWYGQVGRDMPQWLHELRKTTTLYLLVHTYYL